MRHQLVEKTYQNKPVVNFLAGFQSTYLDSEQKHYSVTIGKSPQEVFNFWRNFSNLKYFMKDISDIEVLSPTISHWKVELKSGMNVQWDVEICGEQAGQMISWRS